MVKNVERMPIPIEFCIPERKLVREVPEKTKLVATYLPKFRYESATRYIYDDEQSYYEDYRRSLFAHTKKKAGWDCLRHYEIMSQGCIPLFENLEDCPAKTMTLLPKDLLLEAKQLYASMTSKFDDINTTSSFKNSSEYPRLLEIAGDLLDHTRRRLTTKALAEYVLEKSGHAGARSVLYISGLGRYGLVPNYMRDLLLQGFKELLGSDCHEVPRVPFIYDDFGKVTQLYGKGFTYTKNIPSYLRDNTKDTTCEMDVQSNEYDVIIYGSYHDGMPMHQHVLRHYGKASIVLICGDDLHDCDYQKYVDQGYPVFVRELQ